MFLRRLLMVLVVTAFVALPLVGCNKPADKDGGTTTPPPATTSQTTN